MAKFKIGDWVKITPTPDTKSDVWTSEHNKFCDKIGLVEEVNEEYDDIILMRVTVDFKYKLDRISGERSAWFEDKHLIKSSQWESDRIKYLNKKFEEYQQFEQTVKRKRDKILKDIFSDPYEQEREMRKAMEEIIKQEENNAQNWTLGDGWYMTDYLDDSDTM